MMNVIDDFDINHSDECTQNPDKKEVMEEVSSFESLKTEAG
jgi:hypothetical protein